jgi:uncharacterized protein
VQALTIAQLRRFVVAHQAFATRFRRGRAEDVEAAVRRLSCVQLDSISTVERAHRLTLLSRVGWYRPGTVSRLLAAGRIFEYWAHEACLCPIEDFPLFKRRMEELRERHWWGRKRTDRETEALVLKALRERGPLPSRAFEGSGSGGMWSWKPAKLALEHLFAAGEVVVAGRESFQRLYELPERVIPREHLEAPTPSEEEFRRGLALRAVRARGAVTASGIADHYRLRGGAGGVRAAVDSLVAEGRIRRVPLEDGGPPVLVPADADLDADAAAAGVLLSPFDNLLWDRAFVERVFGFRHLIEVYKRAHERVYGYYVLPFLLGDRLAGRADLKAERSHGVLRLRAFHLEPGVRSSRRLDEALERALARLARSLDLSRVAR